MSTPDSSPARLADRLRALHVPGRPLILPNVWDAASARVVAEAGFPAVATGSAPVAASLGHPDGEVVPPAEMLAAVTRVVRAAGVPVTADMERGYGLAPAEFAERLAATGAVGCNLEDTDPRTGRLVDAGEQADFLAALRAADPDLVINARTDALVREPAPAHERPAEAARRIRLYLEAGADCVYPFGPLDEEATAALVAAAGGRPVNVIARPGGLTTSRLAELGVARISYGHQLHTAVLRHLADLVAVVRDGGSPFAAG
ncbi:isocitrate lyase/phosphoenolpyruvate mutase family protein [Streptomyces sp. NPDC046977]|uniref:isocitrate lyase/PEP mutase family protein n=1 Tax=Streptomyces sp. NPDC046977 TaxID=3154703 RepID=UPI0033D1611D